MHNSLIEAPFALRADLQGYESPMFATREPLAAGTTPSAVIPLPELLFTH